MAHQGLVPGTQADPYQPVSGELFWAASGKRAAALDSSTPQETTSMVPKNSIAFT